MMKTSIKTTLACTAALAGMGVAQAQGLPSSVWFDGYCDGFSNITDVGGGVVTGYYDLTNCGYSDMLPSVGAGGNTKGVGIDYHGSSFDTTGFAPLFRLSADGTGTVYWTSGNSLGLTWTAGSPLQRKAPGTTPALAPR